jgi:hypothetical protein
MAYMPLSNARLRDVGVGVAIGAAIFIELAIEGALVVVGLMFLGAVVGVWALVYDRCLCGDRPVPASLVKVWAIRGAVVMPGLAALHLVLGMVVWGIAAVALFAWFVAMAMRPTGMQTRRTSPNASDY